jgi:hypothetical protein
MDDSQDVDDEDIEADDVEGSGSHLGKNLKLTLLILTAFGPQDPFLSKTEI